MKHGTLQDALESERRLHVGVVLVGQQRRLLVDEFGELPAQLGNVRVAGLEDLVDARYVEQGEQQVLDRHELMTALSRPLKGLIQTEFELAAEHSL